MTTLKGCVYREKDIPGRAPNVVERAGFLEDYILVQDRSGTQQGMAAGNAMPTGSMYKLELIDDEKLQAVVGKHVEVTGRIDKEADDSSATPSTAPSTSDADKVMGRDRVDLPEFEVASIREVEGTCAAKPAER